MGLKAKPVTEHSNAAPNGQVLSTTPATDSKVDPGSDVTLTVARNTAPLDLITTAGQATWKSKSGKLTFPGNDADKTDFVLIRDSATLEDDTIAQVLETHPQWITNGSITGAYTLPEPAVPGDHILARVGLLKPKAPDSRTDTADKCTFIIKANGKVIQQVTDTADGTLKNLDADLSPAKGATTIEITVLANPSPSQDWAPIWQDLRLEPKTG